MGLLQAFDIRSGDTMFLANLGKGAPQSKPAFGAYSLFQNRPDFRLSAALVLHGSRLEGTMRLF